MIRSGDSGMFRPTPTTLARRTRKFKVLLAGVAVVVLWASTFPAVRVAVRRLRHPSRPCATPLDDRQSASRNA